MNSIFKNIFQMRNTRTINLANEFLINNNEILGKGATGQVYAAKQLKDNTDVAVKVIDLKTVDNEVTQYLLTMEKIAALSCDNPHVLKGIKVIQNNICCYIVTELCNGGSLKNLIKMTGPLREQRSIRILIQILKGSCSLIGKGIIHRDLKPANILMHNGQTKIIDFGYCEIKGYPKPSLQYNVGSPSYMSPEAFMNNEYSEKSQIWAIGVTFYECLNGKTFDQGRNMIEVYKQIKAKGLNYRVQVSDKCKQIINWCLKHDPKKRPTTVELLNFVVQSQKNRTSPQFNSQIFRLSFKPIENVDARKKIYQKLEKTSQTFEYLNKDLYKKQQILKPELQTGFNKVRAILSSYQQKKLAPQQKVVEKRSIFNPPRFKYDRNVTAFDPRQPIIRHKSQFMQSENAIDYSTERLKSKQNVVGMYPVRVKPMEKINEGHRYRLSAHNDYYITVMTHQ